MIVYKITNKLTGKIYIGQTVKPLHKRWAVHKSCKRKSPLTSSFKHHGIESFTIEEICSAKSLEELNELEIYYIEKYDCIYPNGYNLQPGGSIAQARIGMPPWNKGKKVKDPLVLKRQSKSHIGQKAWNKKPIICIQTNEIFDSLHSAAKKLNLQVGHICLVLKGKRNSTGGYTFSYLTDLKKSA